MPAEETEEDTERAKRVRLERLGGLEPGAETGVTVEASVIMAPVLGAAAGA
jgi:hypothetical protein